MTVWVYKHYDSAGVILYVGISQDVLGRQTSHNSSSKWFKEVRRIDIEPYESRDDALQEESRLIRELRPIYNRVAFDRIHGYIRYGLENELGNEIEKLRSYVRVRVSVDGGIEFSRECGLGIFTLCKFAFTPGHRPTTKTLVKISDVFYGEKTMEEES